MINIMLIRGDVMRDSIATIEYIKGSVSAIDIYGGKRLLSNGDSLYLDEVVKTEQDGSALISIEGSQSLMLESLQSIKLTADISPENMLDQSDAVLNSELPLGLVERLFSIYPLGESSILRDIEPVYDIERFKLIEHKVAVTGSANVSLNNLLHRPNDSESLDHFLRFDQGDVNTVVYFSNSGNFTDDSSTEDNADRIITINSIGYSSSVELLSFLIDSYLPIDQV
jgi:hypothetical protein